MSFRLRRFAMLASLTAAVAVAFPAVAAAKVLLVGTYKGIPGEYKTIQAAADAARPGDWILIGPGDYKTTTVESPKGHPNVPAAILLDKPLVFVRGMNRNTVVIDGTKPGTPECSSKPSAQSYGPKYDGKAAGLNGIEVWEADNVWVQNLTTCNFTSGSGDTGNEIWWNGGAGGGRIHGKDFVASYLNATSSFYSKNESLDSTYGLFSSDFSGGIFDHDYASNFNDAGFYIGGCSDQCDQTIENSQSEYNALGYSGTNSGGSMLIEHNKFDQNEDGFDTNSQNNSDWPSPQNGACLPGVKPLISGAPTCWILYDNDIYDNNNPNVPAAGSAAAGPVGTGVSIEGENDTVMDNTITDNGSWGVVFEPYPDFETPPANVTAAGMACHGGMANYSLLGLTINCVYDDWGNALVDNKFTNDGYNGNPTNGDFAELTLSGGNAENCYVGNTDSSGQLTTLAATLQSTYTSCGTVVQTPDVDETFLLEAACDTEALGKSGGQIIGCQPGDKYARVTRVVMHPLPRNLPTMPHPCAGVPANPWCPAKKKKG